MRLSNNHLHDILAPLEIMRRGVRCAMRWCQSSGVEVPVAQHQALLRVSSVGLARTDRKEGNVTS